MPEFAGDRAAGSLKPQSTHDAGYRAPDGHEGTAAQRLTAGELSWQELADALWLATFDSGVAPAAESIFGDADPRAGIPHLESAPPVDEDAGIWSYAARSAAAARPESEGGQRPGAWAVPRAAAPMMSPNPALVRALRPLRTLVPSAHEQVLDEERTAELIAEGGLWLPVLSRAKERLWDAVLVVEDSPSMVVWRKTVVEFRTLLERQGAFRNVQVRRARANDDDGLELFAAAENPAPIAPGTLVDPTGRRLVLLLTDGAGPVWRSGSMHAALRQWGSAHPVVIIQVLPQPLWRHSEINPRPARLRALARGVPNQSLQYELVDSDSDDASWPEFGDRALPVPVLELDPAWLARWAGFVSYRQARWTDLPVLMVPETSVPAKERAPFATPTTDPREQVRAFRALASPTAFSLATALAATPLTVPLAERISQTLLPRSGPAPLAEVMLSGLVHPVGPSRDVPVDELDRVTMDFAAGIREELLAYGRRQDTRRMLRLAAEYFGDRVEAFADLRAALEDPSAPGRPAITPESEPFLRAQRAVLGALSGRYRDQAERLTRWLDEYDTLRLPDAPTVHTAELVESYEDDDSRRALLGASTGTGTPEVPTWTTAQWFDAADDDVGAAASALRWNRPDDRPTVWGDIPLRSPEFVGREEIIDFLSQHHGDATGTPMPVTLAGMAGVGKTRIAVEYIYRHLAGLDLVWWIRASAPALVSRSLTELAMRLGLPEASDVQRAIPAVWEALRTGKPFRRWLLVFDDARDPVQHAFLPTGGPGLIVVTTRNPQWAEVSRTLMVDVFSRRESIEVLTNHTAATEVEADQVAARLGDLPLAIAQAATWLDHTGMPVDEYLRALDRQTGALLNAHGSTVYQVPVGAAFAVSLNELARDNPAAWRLLQVCALLPAPLALSDIYRARGQLIPRIASELDEILRDPIQLGRAIRDLRRYSLVYLNHKDDRIEIHPVVRAVVLDKLSPLERQQMLMGTSALLERPDSDPRGGDPQPP